MINDSLKARATRGVIWSAVERFSVQGIQFLLNIIIARLIIPAEYGLIAMLGIFLAVAQVFIDSGFSNALIQKKNRTEIDFSTVFYFNILVAFGVYLSLYISAPYIARFYNEIQLENTTRWLGLGIVISAFSIVQRAKLTINLDFKTLAKVSLISVLVSGGIGVGLAYYGFGVWALVAQSLINSFVSTLLLWLWAHWMPILIFSWKSFRSLFSFGSKLLLSSLLHTIYTNLYSLVIGKRYSAIDVGYYNRASSLALFPSLNIATVITRAIYPIQCELQDDDERLKNSFIQYLRITCYVIFPFMVGIAVLSKPLVILILTDKWLPMAHLLSLLCFAYMWAPVSMLNSHLLNVKGRSDCFFKAEIIKKTIGMSILFLTMPLGLEILCWGLVVYYLIDLIITVLFVKNIVGIACRKQLKNICQLFLLALIMGALIEGFIFYSDHIYIQLFGGIGVGIGSYFLLSYLFHLKEFSFLKTMLKLEKNK